MPDISSPTVGRIKRHAGIAGQYAYAAQVTYPGEPGSTITFVGSTYGGPIVMVTPDGTQVIVSSRVADRIGSRLNPQWIRDFFAPVDGESR